jgi:Matrixin
MFRRTPALVLAAIALAALPAAASAAQQTASATGVAEVRGVTALVEVYVQVQPGETAREATNAALAEQGARRAAPPTSGGPGFTGLVWDVLPMTQSYNPTGEAVAAQSLLQATQATWSSVPGSDFAMGSGGTTSRCPSIVQECPGPQRIDGFNDVGWARLSNGTLGVTWSIIGGTDEADMALSTRVPWHTGCTTVANSFDTQTVLLHENGHVAGLDHATNTASVMYPYYGGARCTLDALDQQAIQTLYPAGA